MSTSMLAAEDDRFGGKLVNMASVAACADVGEFTAALDASLVQWRAEGKGGIWL